MKRFLMLIIAGLLLATVFPALAQNGDVPRFEPAECMFDVPRGQDPDCGYLVVPEDRDDPDAGTIRLAVAVFRSPNPDAQPTPMIYLEGGPGGSTLDSLNLAFNSLFAPFLQDRDVILFDQRGVGQSQPTLDCPELVDVTYDILDEHITIDENIQRSSEAITDCGARLRAEGVDLADYNSAENAADVNDLREVLGYEQLNLLGISYGSRLALTIMRDFPDTVRSAIIDSAVPLQSDKFEDVLNADRAFNALFDACAADPACNEAFPNLKQVFFETAEALDANPGTLRIPNLRTGGTIEAVIDGTTFIGLNFQAMYVTDLIAQLPEAIYAARDGDLSAYIPVLLVQLITLDQVAEGMFYATNCNDDFAFATAESIQAILDQAPPELMGFARVSLIDPIQLTLCADLGTGTPDPKENQPVVSDIPALVLAGEFDPVTPPEEGRRAAETLSRSYFYEFPGLTHGVTPANDCTLSIARAFFDDPTSEPDTTCIEALPEFTFITPNMVVENVEVSDVNLVPFTDETFGISGVKPEGWNDVQLGTVARGQGLNDQTALVQMAVPMPSPEQFMALFATQLGLDAVPASTGTREANGLTWTLYQFDLFGFPSDLALASSNGMTYMIQMTSNLGERDAMYEQVFLPVIDNFMPML